MRFAVVVLGLLAMAAIAGCAQSTEPGSLEPAGSSTNPLAEPTQDAEPPEPTKETGSLRVETLDDELQPVTAVQVVLANTERSALSDRNGVVTFNGLQPAKYTVLASKPGFETREANGRVAEVVAGQATSVRLTLNPVVVVTEETSYYHTEPMRGMIACAANLGIVGGYSQCGRGVEVAGTTYLRDPNDNSTHPWWIDNGQIVAIWVEMEWEPTSSGLGTTLLALPYGSKDCSQAAYCSYQGSFGARSGDSPLRWLIEEGDDDNITGRLPESPAFPLQRWVDVQPANRPLVPPYNAGYNMFLNQQYDLFLTMFYGEAPPPAFTALAPTA